MLAYIEPLISEKKKKTVSDIIVKFGGSITTSESKANIIIRRKLFICDHSTTKTKSYSVKCIEMMDKEVINPFTFSCDSNAIINLHLRNKSFSFVNCSDEVVKQCSALIQMMCGKIKKNNPNYFLTSIRSKENATCILTDWLYALQNSSSYIFPHDFLASDIPDLKATPETTISLEIKDRCDSFQFSREFFQDAYVMMKSKRYSYPRLKKELQLIDKYSRLRNENLLTFIDACQIGFAQLRTQEKHETNAYSDYLHSLPSGNNMRKGKASDLRNSVLRGNIKQSGRWSSTETRQLLYILQKGQYTHSIFNQYGNIDWVFVASNITGRVPKACEDKYKSMLRRGEIDQIEKNQDEPIPEIRFNKLLHKAFTPSQEEEILSEVLRRIDEGIPVAKYDISSIALDLFYTPLNLAMKAFIYMHLDNKEWPFGIDGNINVESFNLKLNDLLKDAEEDPESLMDKYGIKQFKASMNWVAKFMQRHRLVYRECSLERRGGIDESEVEEFLEKMADAIATYKPCNILNMDQTFVNTYIPPKKQIARKGQQTVKIAKDRVNTKEGTTYIATIAMDCTSLFPLYIIAKGSTALCEEKYEIDEANDDKIDHTVNGWTTGDLMIKYLNWLSQLMNGEPFVLVLDSYRAHKQKKVKDEAEKLNIELIYIPSCGTGKFQPLDRFIFGFLKKKLMTDFEMQRIPPEKRFSFVHQKVHEIWTEISSKLIKKAWEIPGLKDFVYYDSSKDDESFSE